MKNTVEKMTAQYTKQNKAAKSWQKVVMVLACIVVFFTTYALILPALTWDQSLTCEIPEHTHTDECYETETAEICGLGDDPEHVHTDECYENVTTLVCGLEEHTHGPACYDAPPAEDDGYFCGKVAHEHNENCYDASGSLICTMQVHVHDLTCLSDPEADLENESDWTATFADADLNGDWRNDVISIAKTQLGYTESEKNYAVLESGLTRGYTRYGAWCGSPYTEWDAAFCSFCAEYAGVRDFPAADDCGELFDKFAEEGLCRAADAYVPKSGDLIFLDTDGDPADAEQVGLVSGVEDGIVSTIEGGRDDCVAAYEYAADDEAIVGYALLPEQVTVSVTNEDVIAVEVELIETDEEIETEDELIETDEETEPGDETEETERQMIVPVTLDEFTETYEMPTFNAAGDTPTPILIVAASDFQDPNTSPSSGQFSGAAHNYNTQNTRLTNISNKIKAYYTGIDAYAFFAGGDYGFDSNLSTSNTNNGITQIQSAMEAAFPNLQQEIFVQGNHDNTTGNWTGSGAYDTDYYGVFAISEDDFPAKTGTPKASTLTALDNYLAGRVTNHPDQPVFILTHVPLHFDLRTVAEGDGMYGKRLFDIVSDYGDDLNIIFLYGHNHAHGDDDYIGGSANFYTVGDTIKVAADGSRSSYTTETLNFTYMNYGYTGYYWEKWVQSFPAVQSLAACNADDTLTMTSFLITGNSVEICRWDDGTLTDGNTNGLHNLKSAGAASNGDHVSGSWNTTLGTDTTVVTSPQTVGTITPITPDPDWHTLTDTPTGITVTCYGVDPSLTVTPKNSVTEAEANDAIGDYVGYQIAVTDFTGTATVVIPLSDDAAYDTLWYLNESTHQLVEVTDAVFANTDSDDKYDKVTFTTDHVGTWIVSASPVITPEEPVDPNMQTFTDPATGIEVTCYGSRLIVTRINEAIAEAEASTDIGAYAAYDISVVGFPEDATATVVIPLMDEDFNALWYLNETSHQLEEVTDADFADNTVTFTTDHFSTWVISAPPDGEEEDDETTSGGLASGDYWVKCTSTADIKKNETYMIVRNGHAFGRNGSNVSTDNAVTITEKGQVGNNTYYEITGNGSTTYHQWTLSTDGTGGTVTNAVSQTSGYSTTNYYLTLSSGGNAITTSSSKTTFSLQSDGTWRISRKPNYTTYYLSYDGSSFAAASSTANANMTVYKKVTYEAPVLPSKLKFTNDVTGTAPGSGYVAGTTAFTFTLKSAAADTYGSASPAQGVSYKIYNAGGDQASTGATGTNGTFSLKAGQYVVFEGLDAAKYYFISETPAEYVTTISGRVSGSGAVTDPVESGSEVYLPVGQIANGVTRKATLFHTVADPDPSFNLTCLVTGSDSSIPTNSDMSYIISTAANPGELAEFDYYELYNSDGTLRTTVKYSTRLESIDLLPGMTAKIFGLASGSYTIEEYPGAYAASLTGVSAAVNDGEPADLTDVSSVYSTAITYGSSSSMDVVFNNTLPIYSVVTFDFGDGRPRQQLYTNEFGKLDTLPEPERDNYTFKDWHTEPNKGGVVVDADTVYDHDVTLYAHWDPFKVVIRDADCTKTIDTSTAYATGKENMFDIDLDVVMPSNKRQAIVLLLDLSTSMSTGNGGMCAICGAQHYNSSSGNNSHTTYTGGSETTSYNHAFVPRITLAKNGATGFIDRLRQYVVDTGVEACYVEVVGFWKNASVTLGATDICVSGNDTVIKNAINGMNTQSGTNIAYGLYKAYSELQNIVNNTTYNVDPTNTFVIMLSDGAPTTNDSVTSALPGSTEEYRNYSNYIGAEATSTAFKSKWQEIWSATPGYEWRETGFTSQGGGSMGSQDKYYYQEMVMGPPWLSEQIHNMGSSLYSVVLGENMDFNTWQSANNYKYVSGLHIDNAVYVDSFSDYSVAITKDSVGDGVNFDQDLIEAELAAFYEKALESVSVVCSNGCVTDPMSDEVEFLGFVDPATGALITATSSTAAGINSPTEFHAVYGANDELVTGALYDPDTRTITWKPSDDDADYNLKYRVRLLNEDEEFEDWDTTRTAYAANGATDFGFTYEVLIGEHTVDHREKSVELPYVHGWLGDFSFTKVGGHQNDATATTLSNVSFTLTHDPSCTGCAIFPADERATINPITVVSDKFGQVSFADLPSGHTYIMTEATPSKYLPAVTYRVAVDYGGITVTSVEDDHGYWNGTAGKLFNMRSSIDPPLPSTGSTGRASLYAAGIATLVTAAFAGGVMGISALRKKKKR